MVKSVAKTVVGIITREDNSHLLRNMSLVTNIPLASLEAVVHSAGFRLVIRSPAPENGEEGVTAAWANYCLPNNPETYARVRSPPIPALYKIAREADEGLSPTAAITFGNTAWDWTDRQKKIYAASLGRVIDRLVKNDAQFVICDSNSTTHFVYT